MIKKIKFFSIIFVFLLTNNSYSLIEVDITRGNLNPLPIAVSPLFADETSNKELLKEINIKNLGFSIQIAELVKILSISAKKNNIDLTKFY